MILQSWEILGNCSPSCSFVLCVMGSFVQKVQKRAKILIFWGDLLKFILDTYTKVEMNLKEVKEIHEACEK